MTLDIDVVMEKFLLMETKQYKSSAVLLWTTNQQLNERIMESTMELDSLLKALLLYKRNKVSEAIELCTEILEKNPYDQVIVFIIDTSFISFMILFLSN